MGMERVQPKDAKFCGEEAPFVDNTGATVSSVHFRSQVGRPRKKLAGSLSASIAAFFPELDWFLASVRRPSGSRLTRCDCFPIDMHVPVVQLSVEDIRSPGPSPREMNKRALLEVDRPTPIGEAPLPRNVLRIATIFATLALSHRRRRPKSKGWPSWEQQSRMTMPLRAWASRPWIFLARPRISASHAVIGKAIQKY
jgi:hypothetical protein